MRKWIILILLNIIFFFLFIKFNEPYKGNEYEYRDKYIVNIKQKNNMNSPNSEGKISYKKMTLIFARYSKSGVDIVRYIPSSGQEEVLLHTNQDGFIPDDVGYLPSPTGKWLFVWANNILYLIKLSTGKSKKIGVIADFQQGMYLLPPYWRNDRYLEFEGEKGTVTCDVEKGIFDKPLASLISKSFNEHETRLVDYCQRHYKKQFRLWLSSFDKLKELDEQLDLDAYYAPDYRHKEPKEFILLRSLGIPGLGSLRPRYVRQVPNMACSAKGNFIANATSFACKIKLHPKMDYQRNVLEKGFRYFECSGASLDVYNVKAEAFIWNTKVAPLEIRSWYPVSTATDRIGLYIAQHDKANYTSSGYGFLRFTSDERLLSYTIYGETSDLEPSIGIFDTVEGKELLHIHNALNSFVIVNHP